MAGEWMERRKQGAVSKDHPTGLQSNRILSDSCELLYEQRPG
jgi:hypothetical protein